MNVITKTDRIYFKVGTDIGPAFIERVISFDWHMGMKQLGVMSQILRFWKYRQNRQITIWGNL